MPSPKLPRLIVASFWVNRPDHPKAGANYIGMLRILDRSCKAFGLEHVVLTDHASAMMLPREMAYSAKKLEAPLMRACTGAQALWLEDSFSADTDTLFVGADCIIRRDPRLHFPKEPGLCVTLRPGHPKYPINTGAQMVRAHSRAAVAAIYRKVADRCGETWCDDQRAIQDELAPMPRDYTWTHRHGVLVGFLPMRPFNVSPRSASDPATGAVMLHFRGLSRKPVFFEWAAKHFPEAPANGG